MRAREDMTGAPIFTAIFWGSGLALAYTFLGYQLLIGFLAHRRARGIAMAQDHPQPEVCAIVVAHNEAALISTRIENLLASDYPPEKLRVLLISDGSTDATTTAAHALESSRIDMLSLAERRGKAAGLNAAVRRASADILVFTDARQRFSSDTIARLTAHFSDPKIGAVSGSLEIAPSESGLAKGVDAYWRMEKSIRAAESDWDSCIGCTGAVYAIRRSAFTPLAPGTILDDVVIPMQIAARGFRVLHDPDALAFDPQPLSPAAERHRKRRTLAGNFQMLIAHPAWLLPWKHRLWWQLISHKYLRLLAPFLLAALFASNLALLAHRLYRLPFICQSCFYALAIVGIALPSARSRILSLPAGFLFLNITIVRGFIHFLRSPDAHRWTK